MRIRVAERGDLPAILKLSVRMHAESRFKVYPLNMAKVHAVIDAFFQTPQAKCLFLAQNTEGEVVGMLGAYMSDCFFSDVLMAQEFGFYVSPEHRGSSAAVKLITMFKKWAENRQAKEITINMSSSIDVRRFNVFLQRMGFRSCGSNFVMALGGAV